MKTCNDEIRHHIHGFDYLRALFAVLVVVWHANGVGFLAKLNPYLQHFINIFYYNICLLAVPTFFSISLFLLYKKQKSDESYLLKKRLIHLIQVYCVWMFIGIVFNSFLSRGDYVLNNLLTVEGFLRTMVVGTRPELFFLFSLILISSLGIFNSTFYLGNSKNVRTQCIFAVLSLLILPLSCFYTLKTDRTILLYWNPICFLPYIFSSYFLLTIFCQNSANSKLSKLFYQRDILIVSLTATFLMISWLEWKTFNVPNAFGGYLLPPYARVSLVIGSFLVCYLVILYIQKPPPYLILSLSKESLGIFLMHNYFLFLTRFWVLRLKYFQFPQALLEVIFNPITNVVIAVIFSVIVSKLLKRCKLGRWMLLSSQ